MCDSYKKGETVDPITLSYDDLPLMPGMDEAEAVAYEDEYRWEVQDNLDDERDREMYAFCQELEDDLFGDVQDEDLAT